ncbi:LacI family DNA-binding transcriptional regulator [Aurantimonas sp. VKM B-3413]|uniref:LacI family DNA-binding transcriptional regulator n=1 Tax=Aurantimonas sp. VKM B-3413 TaxID=2779401 RepID=UPI001E2A7677|nr:LacI family DNA-binding transcriptional regulator [Aurantimonas sp. VKM B-3413]MCB8836240.1 LacI family DNA-binding transcriptional regulator [Aurantimonas sp. VKM B-3413]
MKLRSTSGFVSAQDVARLAGVSRSAVSRTFTPGASVSAETRKRVMAAAEALGYHVNHLARGLISQTTSIVCLVVSDIATPYLSSMVDALTRRLQEAGKVAMVINATGRLEKVEDAISQTLHYRADATVVLSGSPDRTIIQTCLDSGQRMILLNRDEMLAGIRNVSVDNATAARQTLHAFLQVGRRRLAVVASAARTPSLVGRETGFVDAARAAGLEVTRWSGGATAHASGAAGARHLLAQTDRPDAVFCVTDLLACGFMDAARHEFGLRIPEDVSVIGFDDIEQAAWPSYALTTFAQPIAEIADYVVACVMADDAAEAGPLRLFPAPMIWRGTVHR